MKYRVTLNQNGRYQYEEIVVGHRKARLLATELLKECRCTPLRWTGSIWRWGHASLNHPAFGPEASVIITQYRI